MVESLPAATPKTPIRYVVGLDLMRVLAASIVCFYHLSYWIASPTSSTRYALEHFPAYPELNHWTSWGWVGVEIFFVISGFVIANSAQGRTGRDFLIGRLSRLMPGVWICATLTLLVTLAFTDAAPVKMAVTWLRTLVLFPKSPWIDGPYWTLCVEVVFYLLVAVMLFVRKFERIGQIMAVVGGISLAYWLLQLAGLWWEPARALDQINRWRLEITLVRHGYAFALGVFLWLGLSRGWTAWRLAGAAAMLMAGAIQITFEAENAALFLGRPDPTRVAPLILWLACVGLLILSVRRNAEIAGLFSGALPAISLLGLATYPLYLVHSLVGQVVTDRLFGLGVNRYVALATGLVVVFGLAILVAKWFEPGLRQLVFRRR